MSLDIFREYYEQQEQEREFFESLNPYRELAEQTERELENDAKWDEFLRNEEEALNLKKPITSCYEKDARKLLEEIPF